MVDLGADYSDARPGGALLHARGAHAVGRYLSDDPARGVTPGEYADLTQNGVGLWVCRESSQQAVLGGRAQGVADATDAVRMLKNAGLPAGMVVYGTVDFDVLPGQYPVADAYFDGWNSVIPPSRTGAYGGLAYLNHLYATGRAKWFWVSASTSFAHGQTALMPIHLQQTTNTPPAPGTDHDFIYDTSSFAGGNATPITETDSDMPQNWNINGTIVTIGETFARVWTNPNDFSYKTNIAAWGAPVAKSLTPDQLKTIVNERNAWGAALTQTAHTPITVADLKPITDAIAAEETAILAAIPKGTGTPADLKPLLDALAAAQAAIIAHIPTKLAP